MSVTIDSIAERILANEVDKQEAIRSFEGLTEAQRDQLILLLKGKIEQNGIHNGGVVSNGSFSSLKAIDELSIQDKHLDFITELSSKLAAFAPTSKSNALKHQQYFVDQRKITNLKKMLKPLQFHLTYERAEGAYLYDVDGNKYIDITGDNGVNIFGHQAEFINKAIESRLARGFPLVGYTEELFEAAKLFRDLTGHERVLFTQSGTEAVMWAVRIARAVTNRKKIVIFEGSYHGMSDTVFAFKDMYGNSQAPGLGMLQEYADQLIILDYGKLEQLDLIEHRSHEIAAVLVEPVQSRHPYIQPAEFLKELRKLTLEQNILLIFDEMITGLRAGRKGAQGYFNVQADIATYGKVPGGGMPTGIVAGLAKYMNYVDGGTWNFDDDSMPSLRRTLMAGTHTRNPVKISAVLATLQEIRKRCPDSEDCATGNCFHAELNRKTKAMVEEINTFFNKTKVPVISDTFSSLFKFRFLSNPNGLVNELFFILLRMNGVETSVSGNFFLTTAHSDNDIKGIVAAVKRTTTTLVEQGFFCEPDPVEMEAEEILNGHEINQPQRTPKDISDSFDLDLDDVATHASPEKLEQLKHLLIADLNNFMNGSR